MPDKQIGSRAEVGSMTYQVTFWGTRGSIPTPGPGTARYGGNTPSIEVRKPTPTGDAVAILDGGTGVRGLGRQLVANGNRVSVDLLVSHTHWDHIQGLPFFRPFFEPGNQVRIWGARQAGVDLEEILRNQMSPVVFPVPLDGIAAELAVQHIGAGEFEAAGFTVRAMQGRHPGTTLGFRLTPAEGGTSFAYVPDNELGSGGDYDLAASWRADFVGFLRGADVLIHDAMYTPDELDRHRGWGHSSYMEAVELAVEADVKQLVMFHHRPEHDDEMVDSMLEQARKAAKTLGSGIDVIAAREGLELTL
jgi:phosphoribosyl 1,2-cyclic phosphodiesterase